MPSSIQTLVVEQNDARYNDYRAALADRSNEYGEIVRATSKEDALAMLTKGQKFRHICIGGNVSPGSGGEAMLRMLISRERKPKAA